MNATLTACDKDSSGGYVKTFEFKNKIEFLEGYKEFEEAVPFPRWYLEVESDNADVESWLE